MSHTMRHRHLKSSPAYSAVAIADAHRKMREFFYDLSRSRQMDEGQAWYLTLDAEPTGLK